MSEPRFAIFGAGAVGGYLAGALWRGGARDVTLIGRPRVVEAVNDHGLIVRELTHVQESRPAACTVPLDVGTVDYVLLTVRTYDVESAIDDLRALLGQSGVVLAFQNGVGTEEILGAALGRERVLPCTLTVSAGMESPGTITRYSKSGGVALSSMTGDALPQALIHAFDKSGLPLDIIPDYRSLRWSKLLLNMLGAATTAILDMDLRLIVESPNLFRIEQLAIREAGRVMDAAGIPTVALPGYPVPLVRALMRLLRPLSQAALAPRLVRARGGRSPSMRADMARGKSEADTYNGAVASEASRRGLPAPVNAALAELTQALANDATLRASYRHWPERLVTEVRCRGARM